MQTQDSSQLKPVYDFVVCGAGSSGSVVAARLASDPNVQVLLLEAGGSDNVPEVRNAALWPLNLGSERDWQFQSVSMPQLNDRSIPMSMGKVLGGGSSINAMTYARGHKADWDFFGDEAGDPDWGYAAVLQQYKTLEDFRGQPDPAYRGVGGPVFVEPASDPHPIARAMVEGAIACGLPAFENANGRMMESSEGVAMMDLTAHDCERRSIFQQFVQPVRTQANLTVLTSAHVSRVMFDGRRAVGVNFLHDNVLCEVRAAQEVVLSLGAIHTPKVLMQSGIGDRAQLLHHGIETRQHLPGVGQNFQDHVAFGCVWELPESPETDKGGSATCYARSRSSLTSPDIYICFGKIPFASPETFARFGHVTSGWTMFGGVVQPKSKGTVQLTGPNVTDPVRIDPRMLTDPEDMQIAIRCVELCREIGNSSPMESYRKREVMPGNLRGAELENFVRDAALTYWHQCGTAKMGRDPMAVVDAELKVYGVENLRIADASVLPRITTGNTMAPCIIIGYRAALLLSKTHGLTPKHL